LLQNGCTAYKRASEAAAIWEGLGARLYVEGGGVAQRAQNACATEAWAGMTMDLLLNAIVAGLMLGGFYAAVTVGVSISFGMLDVVNIAHPAFIIVGSYIAYIVNATFGLDPILTAILVLPAFYALGQAVYQVFYWSFEKRGEEALRGLAFFFGLLFITEVSTVSHAAE
jgi:hypothetical protein